MPLHCRAQVLATSGGAASAQISIVAEIVTSPIAEALTAALAQVSGGESGSATAAVGNSGITTVTTTTGSGSTVVSGEIDSRNTKPGGNCTKDNRILQACTTPLN